MSSIQLGIIVLLPPIYKLLGINDDLTMICLTASAGITGVYLGANAISKGKTDEPS
jgi:hypothetical protein